eukprot:TRINITY_DN2670_c0_g1_i1.p1 TRINITY_DN2670_c0_g1~~TRINITY_DN2670_c0_g1_i1.p1  ORF type:complete len:311 (-),score=100.96 TRINITY_DN2670_c0_g1_i1:172-1104(-)
MSNKQIVVHNGAMHADECACVWMLKQLPEFAEHEVVRTRDKDIIEHADIVCDVGDIYDHEKKRYDHHQSGFEEKFNDNAITKHCAAGLIYRHYGKDVILSLYPDLAIEDVDAAYESMYWDFFHMIDANDNGVDRIKNTSLYLYKDYTSLPSRINFLDQTEFDLGVEMCGVDFKSILKYFIETILPARKVFEKAWKSRHDIHSSGKILVLDNHAPVFGYIYDEEEENEKVLFIVFPTEEGDYRIRCVPERGQKFSNRKSFPKNWGGKRDQELSELVDVEDAIFVHTGRFIGGARSRESAIKMAILAVENDE